MTNQLILNDKLKKYFTLCIPRKPEDRFRIIDLIINVGPTSSTLVQHCTNVLQLFCVYWVYCCSILHRRFCIWESSTVFRDAPHQGVHVAKHSVCVQTGRSPGRASPHVPLRGGTHPPWTNHPVVLNARLSRYYQTLVGGWVNGGPPFTDTIRCKKIVWTWCYKV